MHFITKEQLNRIKQRFPEGTRIRLIRMDDPRAVPKWTLGTVTGVDDTGSLLVRWDNGQGLNVLYGEDVVEIVQNKSETKDFASSSQELIGLKIKNETSELENLLFDRLRVTHVCHLEDFLFEGKLPNQQRLLVQTKPIDESGGMLKIIKIRLR